MPHSEWRPRRIVQIATMGQSGEVAELYALCADGTVWLLSSPSEYRKPEDWIEMPPIPHDEDE